MKANDTIRKEFLTNPAGRIRIALEENASAEYLVLQDGAEAAAGETFWEISLPEGASLKMVFLSLDGSVSNHLDIALAAAGPPAT